MNDSSSETLAAPGPTSLIREARCLIELPRLLLRFPELARQPRGRGEPVLILPGYGAGDVSTLMLKSYLCLLGYRARGWGLGRNVGDAGELLPRVLERAAALAQRNSNRVHLIGWSFGGYLARELARDHADLIGRVVTLGTPVVGGPKYTVFAPSFQQRGIDVEALAAAIAARGQVSLRTPVVAIYSRQDTVVCWQACIDRKAANVEHVEVRTTHFGFGFCPEVYKIIAQHLACGAVDP